MSAVVLSCRDVSKIYASGSETVPVLSHLNLEVEAGAAIAIRGVSGSGKSTLLNLLGGLDDPSSGEIRVQGELLAGLNESKRARLRNLHLGFVYPFHHLLPEFSAVENVAMPLLLRGTRRKEALAAALELLAELGLSQRAAHRPSELSGGERQRIAIARALVTRPACVLMDEPTGNLDRDNARRVLELIAGINDRLATAVILVTHDDEVAGRLQRQLVLENGRLDGGQQHTPAP